MTSAGTGRAASLWQVPTLDASRRIFTGTAAGLARELDAKPLFVRITFLILTLVGGWGILFYAVAFVVLFVRTRTGVPYVARSKAAGRGGRIAGLLMVWFGVLFLVVDAGELIEPAVAFPVALVGGAVAVALDRSQIEARNFGTQGEFASLGRRVGLGLVLLFAGIVVALSLSLSFWQAVRGVVVAGFVLAGAGVVFAPFLVRLFNDLLAERRMRIRSEERAEMAAHLHDSVLQTLALVQKRSDDVGVVNLARRQERELRAWLFDDKRMHESLGFHSQLEVEMAEVEDLYEIPIEIVVVGDCASSPGTDALLRAAREAATNAARHSGTTRIDVFAEVQPDAVDVFVRDLGSGFVLSQVESDRVGIRDSIVGRMKRHGGSATVLSTAGAGTEVELHLPLDAAEAAEEPANSASPTSQADG